MAELELLGVTKRFGAHAALANVDFAVEAREFVSIVGASGSGKTTLLRIVAGLTKPDQGSVKIGERTVDQLPPRDRDVAMVFQGESLYPHLTVFENIAFPLRMRSTEKSEVASAVQATAERVGIADFLERMPSTLSGGERQRVALGRALVRNPRVLLLDEPFAHLDTPLRRQLGEELVRLREHWRATTLFVTHDETEAKTLAHRVAIMKDGALQHVNGTQGETE